MDLKEKENILYATVKEIKVICNRGRIRQSQISHTAFKDIQWIKFTWTWTTWSCSVVSDCLQPMDCSLPGSPVHGTFQARVLEWIAISFSKGSSQPRDWTRVFRIVDRQTLYHLSHQGSPIQLYLTISYPVKVLFK